MTAERVLRELARIAFFDIGEMLRPDGSMIPLDKMDEDARRAIAGIEIVELGEDRDGNSLGQLRKIKIADKLVALDRLARHLGLLNDKLIVKGDAENPVMILVRQSQGTAIKPVVEHAGEGG